jgi:hypothetical protein
VAISSDAGSGLEVVSAAQCQHIRAVATEQLAEPVGNGGPQMLDQVRGILADLLDPRQPARDPMNNAPAPMQSRPPMVRWRP